MGTPWSRGQGYLVQKERENVVSQKLGQWWVEAEGAGFWAEVSCVWGWGGGHLLSLQTGWGPGHGVARGDATRLSNFCSQTGRLGP